MNRCYSQTLLTASRVDFEKLPTAGDCLRTDGPRHKLSSQAAARSRQTSTPADDGFSLSRSPLSQSCFEQRLGNTHTHTQRCLVSLTISQVGTGHEGESNWKSSPLEFKIFFFLNCNLQTELGRMWLIFWPLLSFHLLRENTFWPLRLCSHVLSLHRWRGAVGSLVHKLFSVTVKSNKKKKGDHCWRFYPRNGACLVGRAALWGRGWRTPIWLNSTFQLIFTGFIYKQSFSMQSQWGDTCMTCI